MSFRRRSLIRRPNPNRRSRPLRRFSCIPEV
jgi:hypothetical protein